MASKINERDKCGDDLTFTVFFIYICYWCLTICGGQQIYWICSKERKNNDDVHHLKSLNGNMLHLHSYYTITFCRPFWKILHCFCVLPFWCSNILDEFKPKNRFVTFAESPSTLVTAVANFTRDSKTCVCGHRKNYIFNHFLQQLLICHWVRCNWDIIIIVYYEPHTERTEWDNGQNESQILSNVTLTGYGSINVNKISFDLCYMCTIQLWKCINIRYASWRYVSKMLFIWISDIQQWY